jgi:hypothetical protein
LSALSHPLAIESLRVKLARSHLQPSRRISYSSAPQSSSSDLPCSASTSRALAPLHKHSRFSCSSHHLVCSSTTSQRRQQHTTRLLYRPTIPYSPSTRPTPTGRPALAALAALSPSGRPQHTSESQRMSLPTPTTPLDACLNLHDFERVAEETLKPKVRLARSPRTRNSATNLSTHSELGVLRFCSRRPSHQGAQHVHLLSNPLPAPSSRRRPASRCIYLHLGLQNALSLLHRPRGHG